MAATSAQRPDLFGAKTTERGSATASFVGRGLGPTWRAQMLAWVERLGLDHRKIADSVTVERRTGGGAVVVHFAEYLEDGDGRRFLDGTGEGLATRRITVPTDDAPEWLRNLVAGGSQ